MLSRNHQYSWNFLWGMKNFTCFCWTKIGRNVSWAIMLYATGQKMHGCGDGIICHVKDVDSSELQIHWSHREMSHLFWMESDEFFDRGTNYLMPQLTWPWFLDRGTACRFWAVYHKKILPHSTAHKGGKGIFAQIHFTPQGELAKGDV